MPTTIMKGSQPNHKWIQGSIKKLKKKTQPSSCFSKLNKKENRVA